MSEATPTETDSPRTVTIDGVTITIPTPDANVTYGAGKTIVIDGMELQLPAPSAAMDRMRDYFADRYGHAKDGSLNPEYKEDPMMKDIFLIMYQANVATAALEAIAQGAFTSCEHESQYAGDIVSNGNRIYTPQEGALNALKTMKDESWM